MKKILVFGGLLSLPFLLGLLAWGISAFFSQRNNSQAYPYVQEDLGFSVIFPKAYTESQKPSYLDSGVFSGRFQHWVTTPEQDFGLIFYSLEAVPEKKAAFLAERFGALQSSLGDLNRLPVKEDLAQGQALGWRASFVLGALDSRFFEVEFFLRGSTVLQLMVVQALYPPKAWVWGAFVLAWLWTFFWAWKLWHGPRFFSKSWLSRERSLSFLSVGILLSALTIFGLVFYQVRSATAVTVEGRQAFFDSLEFLESVSQK